MRVLVVKAGWSSLKVRVLDGRDRLTRRVDLPAPARAGVLDWARS